LRRRLSPAPTRLFDRPRRPMRPRDRAGVQMAV
jgi:hypothetical protein